MFIIPMVGQSSRFFKAGFKEPKYKLEIGNATVFDRAVMSFHDYFESDLFLFLVRSDYDAYEFVNTHAIKLGIKRFKIIEFAQETVGQADTVYQGLTRAKGFYSDEEPLYIFNIDTFHLNFAKADFSACDGYLEVFEGEGEHWSFVLPGDDNNVIHTTEKDRVSNLCSNGLYFFKNPETFLASYKKLVDRGLRSNGEYYIAPMYNTLISENLNVKYKIIKISDLIFCGTPDEYENALTTVTG